MLFWNLNKMQEEHCLWLFRNFSFENNQKSYVYSIHFIISLRMLTSFCHGKRINFEKITISFLIRLHLQKFCNIRTYLLFPQVSQSCFNRASRNFACVIEFFNGFYQPRSKLKSMKSFIQNYLSKNWGPKFKI